MWISLWRNWEHTHRPNRNTPIWNQLYLTLWSVCTHWTTKYAPACQCNDPQAMNSPATCTNVQLLDLHVLPATIWQPPNLEHFGGSREKWTRGPRISSCAKNSSHRAITPTQMVNFYGGHIRRANILHALHLSHRNFFEDGSEKLELLNEHIVCNAIQIRHWERSPLFFYNVNMTCQTSGKLEKVQRGRAR